MYGFRDCLRISYVGTHLCGREIETDDDSVLKEDGLGILDGAPDV